MTIKDYTPSEIEIKSLGIGLINNTFLDLNTHEYLVIGDINEYRNDLLDIGQQQTTYWSSISSGLKWNLLGELRPENGKELINENLSIKLLEKTEFTKEEWNSFGITELQVNNYIKSGINYYEPDIANDILPKNIKYSMIVNNSGIGINTSRNEFDKRFTNQSISGIYIEQGDIYCNGTISAKNIKIFDEDGLPYNLNDIIKNDPEEVINNFITVMNENIKTTKFYQGWNSEYRTDTSIITKNNIYTESFINISSGSTDTINNLHPVNIISDTSAGKMENIHIAMKNKAMSQPYIYTNNAGENVNVKEPSSLRLGIIGSSYLSPAIISTTIGMPLDFFVSKPSFLINKTYNDNDYIIGENDIPNYDNDNIIPDLRITKDGNIGIGCTEIEEIENEKAKLRVKGKSLFDNIYIKKDNNIINIDDLYYKKLGNTFTAEQISGGKFNLGNFTFTEDLEIEKNIQINNDLLVNNNVNILNELNTNNLNISGIFNIISDSLTSFNCPLNFKKDISCDGRFDVNGDLFYDGYRLNGLNINNIKNLTDNGNGTFTIDGDTIGKKWQFLGNTEPLDGSLKIIVNTEILITKLNNKNYGNSFIYIGNEISVVDSIFLEEYTNSQLSNLVKNKIQNLQEPYPTDYIVNLSDQEINGYDFSLINENNYINVDGNYFKFTKINYILNLTDEEYQNINTEQLLLSNYIHLVDIFTSTNYYFKPTNILTQTEIEDKILLYYTFDSTNSIKPDGNNLVIPGKLGIGLNNTDSYTNNKLVIKNNDNNNFEILIEDNNIDEDTTINKSYIGHIDIDNNTNDKSLIFNTNLNYTKKRNIYFYSGVQTDDIISNSINPTLSIYQNNKVGINLNIENDPNKTLHVNGDILVNNIYINKDGTDKYANIFLHNNLSNINNTYFLNSDNNINKYFINYNDEYHIRNNILEKSKGLNVIDGINSITNNINGGYYENSIRLATFRYINFDNDDLIKTAYTNANLLIGIDDLSDIGKNNYINNDTKPIMIRNLSNNEYNDTIIRLYRGKISNENNIYKKAKFTGIDFCEWTPITGIKEKEKWFIYRNHDNNIQTTNNYPGVLQFGYTDNQYHPDKAGLEIMYRRNNNEQVDYNINIEDSDSRNYYFLFNRPKDQILPNDNSISDLKTVTIYGDIRVTGSIFCDNINQESTTNTNTNSELRNIESIANVFDVQDDVLLIGKKVSLLYNNDKCIIGNLDLNIDSYINYNNNDTNIIFYNNQNKPICSYIKPFEITNSKNESSIELKLKHFNYNTDSDGNIIADSYIDKDINNILLSLEPAPNINFDENNLQDFYNSIFSIKDKNNNKLISFYNQFDNNYINIGKYNNFNYNNIYTDNISLHIEDSKKYLLQLTNVNEHEVSRINFHNNKSDIFNNFWILEGPTNTNKFNFNYSESDNYNPTNINTILTLTNNNEIGINNNDPNYTLDIKSINNSSLRLINNYTQIDNTLDHPNNFSFILIDNNNLNINQTYLNDDIHNLDYEYKINILSENIPDNTIYNEKIYDGFKTSDKFIKTKQKTFTNNFTLNINLNKEFLHNINFSDLDINYFKFSNNINKNTENPNILDINNNFNLPDYSLSNTDILNFNINNDFINNDNLESNLIITLSDKTYNFNINNNYYYLNNIYFNSNITDNLYELNTIDPNIIDTLHIFSSNYIFNNQTDFDNIDTISTSVLNYISETIIDNYLDNQIIIKTSNAIIYDNTITKNNIDFDLHYLVDSKINFNLDIPYSIYKNDYTFNINSYGYDNTEDVNYYNLISSNYLEKNLDGSTQDLFVNTDLFNIKDIDYQVDISDYTFNSINSSINKIVKIRLNNYYESYNPNTIKHYLMTNIIDNVPHIILNNTFTENNNVISGKSKIYSTNNGNLKFNYEEGNVDKTLMELEKSGNIKLVDGNLFVKNIFVDNILNIDTSNSIILDNTNHLGNSGFTHAAENFNVLTKSTNIETSNINFTLQGTYNDKFNIYKTGDNTNNGYNDIINIYVNNDSDITFKNALNISYYDNYIITTLGNDTKTKFGIGKNKDDINYTLDVNGQLNLTANNIYNNQEPHILLNTSDRNVLLGEKIYDNNLIYSDNGTLKFTALNSITNFEKELLIINNGNITTESINVDSITTNKLYDNLGNSLISGLDNLNVNEFIYAISNLHFKSSNVQFTTSNINIALYETNENYFNINKVRSKDIDQVLQDNILNFDLFTTLPYIKNTNIIYNSITQIDNTTFITATFDTNSIIYRNIIDNQNPDIESSDQSVNFINNYGQISQILYYTFNAKSYLFIIDKTNSIINVLDYTNNTINSLTLDSITFTNLSTLSIYNNNLYLNNENIIYHIDITNILTNSIPNFTNISNFIPITNSDIGNLDGNLGKFTNISSIIIDNNNEFLYVADNYSYSIRRIEISSNYTKTIAGYYTETNYSPRSGLSTGDGIDTRFNNIKKILITNDNKFLIILDNLITLSRVLIMELTTNHFFVSTLYENSSISFNDIILDKFNNNTIYIVSNNPANIYKLVIDNYDLFNKNNYLEISKNCNVFSISSIPHDSINVPYFSMENDNIDDFSHINGYVHSMSVKTNKKSTIVQFGNDDEFEKAYIGVSCIPKLDTELTVNGKIDGLDLNISNCIYSDDQYTKNFYTKCIKSYDNNSGSYSDNIEFSANLIPTYEHQYNIGSQTNQLGNIYISNQNSLNIGDIKISSDNQYLSNRFKLLNYSDNYIGLVLNDIIINNNTNNDYIKIDFDIDTTDQENPVNFIEFNIYNSLTDSSDTAFKFINGTFETINLTLLGDLNIQGNISQVTDINAQKLSITDTILCDSSLTYVGIGTTNPEAKLHIKSNTDQQNSLLILENQTNTFGGNDDGACIEFKTYDTNTTQSLSQAKIVVSDTSSDQANLIFKTRGVNNDGTIEITDKMIINHNGNIGINTISPINKLDVKVTDNYDGIVLNNIDNKKLIKLATDDNSSKCFIGLYDTIIDSHIVKFTNYDNSYINIGNLGIGTDNPQYKLHVVGDTFVDGKITAKELEITGSSTIINTDSYVTESLHINSVGEDSVSFKINHDSDNHDILQIFNKLDNQIFTINNNGNVAIGSTNYFDKKLNIDGDIYVDGKLNGLSKSLLTNLESLDKDIITKFTDSSNYTENVYNNVLDTSNYINNVDTKLNDFKNQDFINDPKHPIVTEYFTDGTSIKHNILNNNNIYYQSSVNSDEYYIVLKNKNSDDKTHYKLSYINNSLNDILLVGGGGKGLNSSLDDKILLENRINTSEELNNYDYNINTNRYILTTSDNYLYYNVGDRYIAYRTLYNNQDENIFINVTEPLNDPIPNINDIKISRDDSLLVVSVNNYLIIYYLNNNLTIKNYIVIGDINSGNAIGNNIETRFYFPKNISISNNKNFILISDTNNNRIKKYDILLNNTEIISGPQIDFTGLTAGDISSHRYESRWVYPKGIIISNDDNIAYISDHLNNKIKVLDLNTYIVRTELENITYPTNLDISTNNKELYILTSTTNELIDTKMRKYDIDNKILNNYISINEDSVYDLSYTKDDSAIIYITYKSFFGTPLSYHIYKFYNKNIVKNILHLPSCGGAGSVLYRENSIIPKGIYDIYVGNSGFDTEGFGGIAYKGGDGYKNYNNLNISGDYNGYNIENDYILKKNIYDNITKKAEFTQGGLGYTDINSNIFYNGNDGFKATFIENDYENINIPLYYGGGSGQYNIITSNIGNKGLGGGLDSIDIFDNTNYYKKNILHSENNSGAGSVGGFTNNLAVYPIFENNIIDTSGRKVYFTNNQSDLIEEINVKLDFTFKINIYISSGIDNWTSQTTEYTLSQGNYKIKLYNNSELINQKIEFVSNNDNIIIDTSTLTFLQNIESWVSGTPPQELPHPNSTNMSIYFEYEIVKDSDNPSINLSEYQIIDNYITLNDSLKGGSGIVVLKYNITKEPVNYLEDKFDKRLRLLEENLLFSRINTYNNIELQYYKNNIDTLFSKAFIDQSYLGIKVIHDTNNYNTVSNNYKYVWNITYKISQYITTYDNTIETKNLKYISNNNIFNFRDNSFNQINENNYVYIDKINLEIYDDIYDPNNNAYISKISLDITETTPFENIVFPINDYLFIQNELTLINPFSNNIYIKNNDYYIINESLNLNQNIITFNYNTNISNNNKTYYQFYTPYQINIDILVVAGGGAGGSRINNFPGGGGGAGEVYITNITLDAGTYIIVVGNGGSKQQTQNDTPQNGYDSGIYTISNQPIIHCKGGGYGGYTTLDQITIPGNHGGSGGGAGGVRLNYSGDSQKYNSEGFGFDGGNGSVIQDSNGQIYFGGGGGGAGGQANGQIPGTGYQTTFFSDIIGESDQKILGYGGYGGNNMNNIIVGDGSFVYGSGGNGQSSESHLYPQYDGGWKEGYSGSEGIVVIKYTKENVLYNNINYHEIDNNKIRWSSANYLEQPLNLPYLCFNNDINIYGEWQKNQYVNGNYNSTNSKLKLNNNIIYGEWLMIKFTEDVYLTDIEFLLKDSIELVEWYIAGYNNLPDNIIDQDIDFLSYNFEILDKSVDHVTVANNNQKIVINNNYTKYNTYVILVNKITANSNKLMITNIKLHVDKLDINNSLIN